MLKLVEIKKKKTTSSDTSAIADSLYIETCYKSHSQHSVALRTQQRALRNRSNYICIYYTYIHIYLHVHPIIY